MAQLRQHEEELAELEVDVAVVTFAARETAEAYVRDTDLPWPLLVDESRQLYQAYHMQRGRWWNLAGPAVCWAYLKLFWQGRRLRRATEDVRQLGGDVLVDPQGIVRLHHVGDGPADRPPISRILDTVRESRV